MATVLKSSVQRQIDSYLERGRPLVVKMTAEGIYLKRKGERWSSAVLCPWGAAFSVACKMKVAEEREKRPVRKVRRGLL